MFLKDADSCIRTSGFYIREQSLGAGETIEGHLVQPPTQCLSHWPCAELHLIYAAGQKESKVTVLRVKSLLIAANECSLKQLP